jgi:hypothetical protein
MLEFWIGGQTESLAENRYGQDAAHTYKEYKYYPRKLAMTFPLSDLPKNIIEQMESYLNYSRKDELIPKKIKQ